MSKDHLTVGVPAPDFELYTVNEDRFRLYEQLTKGPVLLTFFKSSCPTCQLTLPLIQTLFMAAKPNSFVQCYGISQDSDNETRIFTSKNGLYFPVLIDQHPYQVSSDYELKFVPTLFFVNQDGIIQIADFGFSKSTLNEVATQMKVDLECEANILFGKEYEDLPDFRPG